MKIFQFIFFACFAGLWVFVLDNRLKDLSVIGSSKSVENVPALGHLLNPFAGFWANAEPKNMQKDIRIKNKLLKDKVDILLDDRLIPHIFAKNDYDLYFAQGYVTAKFRLWQMEFQTYAAAGRLSEIVGEKALNYDKHQRRIGMTHAAEVAWKEAQKDEITKNILIAYSEGVNAYIEELHPKDYPLEYKLIGYKPEKWSPYKSALMLKAMAQDLSYKSDDWQMTNVLQKYGKDVVKELFPGFTGTQDPIIPAGTKFDFKKTIIPKIPKQISAPLPLGTDAPKSQDRKGIGSNNWAIANTKSLSGLPILANDPHLTLNLPSIWFEIQLVAPRVNVYGASLPGLPCVASGFNQDVAWGVTNVDSDVQDWYYIKFKDKSKKEYWHQKQWKPTTFRIETFKTKEGKTIIDTMVMTHHGFVACYPEEQELSKSFNLPPNCALRWVAHEPSNELLAFYKLNRAKNYDDYRKALVSYCSPAQNFVYADNLGDIAITPNGKFPLKWKEQGKFILDGTNPDHDWQGWIAPNQNPFVKNPERGFVSSANQFSADTLYPYYLHWEFATYERGKRINERLTNMQKATVDSMRLLQYDAVSQIPKDILPTLLKHLTKITWNEQENKAIEELKNWNFAYTKEKIAPTIFKTWWKLIQNATWEDDFGDNMRRPSYERTRDFVLAGDSASSARWFDDMRTPKKENMTDILVETFHKAIQELTQKYDKMGEKWAWNNHRNTKIDHLARIDAFGVKNIVTDGDRTTPNALDMRHGPSWRMVVALGNNPKGYAIYPGGQSGNVGSFYYDNFIKTWEKGELAELLFMRTVNEKSSRIIGKMKMGANL